MPRSFREWAKRKCDMAIGDLTTAQNHLAEVGSRFELEHPDIFEQYCHLISFIEVAKSAIIVVRDSI